LSIQKAATPEISWQAPQSPESPGLAGVKHCPWRKISSGWQVKLKLNLAVTAVGQVTALDLPRLKADDFPKFPRKTVLKACFFVHMN
jgi:hypothetical protein